MVRPVLSLVCLLGLVATAPAETWPMNQRSMQIPIKIEAARRAEIKELALFYSTDQGRTWSQGGGATPAQEAFTFTAPADGLYWFSLMITKRDGTREPPTPSSLPPTMMVIVDTTRPVARITTADRQGDEINVAWQVQDANPDWATFKLEYHTPDMPALMWAPVAAQASASGQARFRPAGNGPVMLRVHVKDQAGNEAMVRREVSGATGSGTITASATGLPPAPLPPPEAPALATTPMNAGNSTPAAPPGGNTIVPPPVAPREADPPVGTALETFQTNAGGRQPNIRGTPPQASMDRSLIPPLVHAPGSEASNRVVATTPDSQAPALPVPGGFAPRGPSTQAPSVTLSNSVQISLDYEVSKVGPSGVGNVELYITRDNGARWDKYADDPDLKPPMVVDLPGEGIYGLALVVRSKAGLGRRAPQGGDKPQLLIEVDTTSPEAQLYAPQPVRGQRDQLVISWEARDKNLAANPIALEWAERQGGPWQPIGVDLPNTGRHTWKLPPNLPYNVFMRLVVRDSAGNASVAETDRPVLVDLSEPEGVITTIRPVPGGQR